LAVRRNIFDQLIDNLKADFLVRFLATPEPELNPHLHLIAKKLDRVIPFGGQVMRVDGRGDLDLLHLASGRAHMGFPFGFFVKELAVVHDPADGGSRLRHDFDEVQVFFLRQAQSVIQGHDSEWLLLVVDYPDFAGADLPVTAVERFSWTK